MGQLASRPPALVWHAAVSCQRGTSPGVASVTAAGTVARRKPLVGSSGAPCLWPVAIKRVGRWQRHGATGTERVDSTRPLLECACLRYLVRRFYVLARLGPKSVLRWAGLFLGGACFVCSTLRISLRGHPFALRG